MSPAGGNAGAGVVLSGRCYRPAAMFIPVSGKNLRRRLIQLLLGLVLFGVGISMMLRSGLGLPPWDVLHQGLANQFGLTVGIWSILISFVVLAAWIPLRERYGAGTLFNAIIIGVVIDVGAVIIPEPPTLWLDVLMMIGGVLLIGLASGMYIGANLGPGPRDGLMTAIARRGPSIRATPEKAFGSAAFTAALMPIRFSWTTLPFVPVFRIPTPSAPLPEIRL